MVRLGDAVTHVGSGVTPRGGKSVYATSGVTFLRSQNVHFDGLRLLEVVNITPETHASMSRSSVCPGDVLLNITGASIGRCTVVPNDLGPANVNQHVCIIRTSDAFNQHFVSKWLSTSRSQREINDIQTGQSRQGLNYQQIRQLTIIRPPRTEQDYIATILAGVDEALKQAETETNFLTSLKASTADALLTGRVEDSPNTGVEVKCLTFTYALRKNRADRNRSSWISVDKIWNSGSLNHTAQGVH